MSNILKIKRGLESARTSITPAEGEFLYTTDEKKLYIGDGSTAGGNLVSGASSITNNVFAIEGTVDLTSASAQDIGTIPANAVILRTTINVTTGSDAVTTVIVGDATNGTSSYMASTENDPETIGTYIADTIVSNGGGARTARATVATAGTVGSAVCIIEYRLT